MTRCPRIDRLPGWLLLVAGALTFAACGGGGSTDAGGGGADAATAVAAPDVTPPPTGGGGSESEKSESDPEDRDQDGVTDDNCPGAGNLEQTDTDGDGKGDPCDDRQSLDEGACGVGAAIGQARDSGDSEKNLLCGTPMTTQPGRNPLGLGTIIATTEQYLLIDVTDDELDTVRKGGTEIVVVDQLVGLTPSDLVELRIKHDPTTALDTVKPAALSGVSPDVLAKVPPDELAAQPDATVAAVPTRFWLEAAPATVDKVGRDRLTRLRPDIELPGGASAQGQLSKPVVGGQDTTTTSSTTTTTRGG